MTQELHIKATKDQVKLFCKLIGLNHDVKSINRIEYVYDSVKYNLIFMTGGEEHFSDVYYMFEDIIKKFKLHEQFYPRVKNVGKNDSSFTAALEQIKNGKSVSRSAWMLKEWELSLVFKNSVTYNQVKTHLGLFAEDEKVGDYPFKFIITNKRGHMVNDNYQLTPEDILAQDWYTK